MHSGNLVPDSIMLDLMASAFRSMPLPTKEGDTPSSFILDGFPRTTSQAKSLSTLTPINLVVHLVTPPSIIVSRIAHRWVHLPSGRVYNTDFNAPKVAGKDDVTGEPLTQRSDDSLETWKERYRQFQESSRGLLEYYEGEGCLWRVEGRSSDEITPKLFAEVERRFC